MLNDENYFQIISSIPDINNPEKEDYKKLQKYISSPRKALDPLIKVINLQITQYGHQPFILSTQEDVDSVVNSEDPTKKYIGKRTGLGLKLLGKNGEMPIKYIYKGNNNTQCIYIYASNNGKYTSLLEKNLNALRKNGYNGDIITLKGGFPNTKNGGLLHCHLPMSFKYAAMEEAKSLGYRYFLWVDSAVISQKNIDYIFKEIEKSCIYVVGGWKLGNHFIIENDNMVPRSPCLEMIGSLESYQAMGLDLKTASHLPYAVGGIYGYDLHSELGKALLKQMKQYINDVTPWISLGSDIVVHSVALHQIPFDIKFHPVPWDGDDPTFIVESH